MTKGLHEMTFKEIVLKTDFETVYKELVLRYEDTPLPEKEKIQRGYDQIRGLIPVKSDELMTIVVRTGSVENIPFTDVSGLSAKDPDWCYSLIFVEWDEWLGYEVSQETLNNFTYDEIVAHCFWEMACNGWTLEDRAYNLEVDNREARYLEQLEKEANTYLKERKLLTHEFCSRLFEHYDNAQKDCLMVGIEIIIEEFLEKDLVPGGLISAIGNKFNDNDIQLLLQNIKLGVS